MEEALAWGTIHSGSQSATGGGAASEFTNPGKAPQFLPFSARERHIYTQRQRLETSPSRNPVIYSSREALLPAATVHWHPIRPRPCLSPANVTAICALPLLSGLAHHFHKVPKLAEYFIPFVRISLCASRC
jgi:hypothetical protein